MEVAVRKIDLTDDLDLEATIKELCSFYARKTPALKLAAAFEAQNQLVLVFQS